MARQSETGNVKKICGCAKWKECAHPWYVDFREGKETINGKVRERGLRRRLSLLVGREPIDFADAKTEARRAIVAWQAGRDARALLPGDTITLEKLLEEYGKRPGAADRSTTPIVKATVQGRRAVLDRRSKDPAGEPLPADAYVFGDEVGRRRHSIKTAWRLTCKRATIDGLHFHDLRREAGSRWMDAGVPLATIQRWLGHHNISQTSTYLAASGGGDADAMRAFERATGRLPNVAVSAGSNGPDQISSSSEAIEKTQSNPVVH